YAFAINNSDSIVGEIDPWSGLPHGFWRAQDGITRELVGLADTFASATAVNEAGKVVGRSRTATGWVHGTLWDLALVDRIPPAVTCGTADGMWHGSDVSIGCTASDTDSGLANPADASFSLTTNIPADTETANATTASRSVCDTAGNCTTAGPISGNKADKKAPTIAISSPTLTTYTLGQTVLSGYSCADGGSGIVACAGT